MPELPDITVYLEALERHAIGHRLDRLRVTSPFLVRTVEPPIASLEGRLLVALRRLGKRLVLGFEGDHWLVLHLMIAGRLQWKEHGTRPPGRGALAVWHFSSGQLVLTEAGTQRRASLHLVLGEEGLSSHDPGGIEVLERTRDAFASALRRENRTLKRALTDPRILSGIGNAWSDEILHAARLSPVARTHQLSEGDVERLFRATVGVLTAATNRLRREAGSGFPRKVTAFRPEMAVHGKFGQPCPVCGATVQRIRYADNETNYCPGCQTGGRLLADRSLSRLLRSDWPRSEEALENLRRGESGGRA